MGGKGGGCGPVSLTAATRRVTPLAATSTTRGLRKRARYATPANDLASPGTRERPGAGFFCSVDRPPAWPCRGRGTADAEPTDAWRFDREWRGRQRSCLAVRLPHWAADHRARGRALEM